MGFFGEKTIGEKIRKGNSSSGAGAGVTGAETEGGEGFHPWKCSHARFHQFKCGGVFFLETQRPNKSLLLSSSLQRREEASLFPLTA